MQAALASAMFSYFLQPSPGTQPARYWFTKGSDQIWDVENEQGGSSTTKLSPSQNFQVSCSV